MTFYAGSTYRKDQVSIGPPDLNLLGSISISSDVKYAVEHWVSDAQKREDTLYFSVFVEQELVGQILLQNINANAGESLIAYHLFRPQLRRQGIGTQALRLLQSHVLSHTA